MKRLFLVLAVMAMVLPGCNKIEESIDALSNRIDKLEQETIPTIDEQIAAINLSINALEATDKELKGYIDCLQTTADNLQEQINATNTKIEEVKNALQKEIEDSKAENLAQLQTAKAEVLAQLEAVKTELENELTTINATIETLNTKDTELDQKIADLRSYVDAELSKPNDWGDATFATLEQYNSLATEVATIKEQIESINDDITALESRINTKIREDIASAVSTLSADIQQTVKEITDAYTNAVKAAKEEITDAYTVAIATAISNLETSMKSWVGEQLSNYYTIAQIDAKIAILQRQIQDNNEELTSEINTLRSSLQAMKTELTAAYQKAITDAINTNNGIINEKIANEIDAVNQRITNEITTINSRLDDIERRLDTLEGKVDDLLSRKLDITFDNIDDIAIIAGSYCNVNYTITSSEPEVHIATVVQNGWKTSITRTTERTGYITVYAPNPLTTEPIIVFVSDANTTIMRNLTFVDGVTTIATESYAITSEATTLSVNVTTNLDYTVNIPTSVSDWVSLEKITSRATVRNDVIKLNIKENTSTASRKATLQLVCNDVEVGTISIYQQGIEVAYNELIYTSSDGKIITPYQTMGFNANIVSNTYENGRGLIVFDKDIESISEYAFYNCAQLTSIKIPQSVTKIGEYAFYSTSITEIDLHKYISEIGDYAFYGCDFTNVTIPDKVTEIKNSVFNYCQKLVSITIPNSVITIGDEAFYYCTSLKSVTIPDSVTSIDEYAFYHCNNLTSVVIGNGVISIEGYAFYYCESLTSITIGKGVTSIGEKAFYNCSSLRSVYCKPTTPPAIYYYSYGSPAQGSFSFNSGMTIYVPRNSYDAYMQYSSYSDRAIEQTNWSRYDSYVKPYDFE